MDTFIICTMTGIVILVTGTMGYAPELTGAQLALRTFEIALGEAGKYILAISMMLFAFTTILGWYWYAETAMTYLFGVRFKAILKLIMIGMILIGASGAQFFDASGNEFMNNLWSISDTLNGLIALPNLIGLLLLSFTIRRIVKDYDAQQGKDEAEESAAEKKPMPKELRQLLAVSVLAAVLSIAIVFVGGGQRDMAQEKDDSLQNVLDSGQLVIGVDADFPPMSFISDDKQLVGFDIDLGREICSRLGVEFVARPIVWENKDNDLNAERIDCICCASVKLGESGNMCLTEPYVNESLVFVIRGDSKVKWMSDLKGKVVGVQAGSTTQDALNATDIRKDITVLSFDETRTILQQVKAGKLDAALVDSLVACYFINSSRERFFILPDSIGRKEFGIAFRKNERKLRDRVQEILGEMKADGTLGRISEKYFGTDITVVR